MRNTYSFVLRPQNCVWVWLPHVVAQSCHSKSGIRKCFILDNEEWGLYRWLISLPETQLIIFSQEKSIPLCVHYRLMTPALVNLNVSFFQCMLTFLTLRPFKFMFWNPNPQSVGIRRWPLGVIRSWGWSPWDWDEWSYLKDRTKPSQLPRRLSGKESTCQWGSRHGFFYPWIEKIPWKRKWQPIPVVLPGKSHRQRSLASYSSWGCKKIRHDWATKLQQQQKKL